MPKLVAGAIFVFVLRLQKCHLVVGLFHDLLQPPFNDIFDVNFLRCIYAPWSRHTVKQKNLYPRD